MSNKLPSFQFQQEDFTEVFINRDNTITIRQIDSMGQEQIIQFATKKRCLDVAMVIRKLAKSHDFEPYTESDQ